MEAEIGHAAGNIWRYLDRHGETFLAKLRQGTRLPDQMLLIAVGWLAREGKLGFGKQGLALKIGLRERSAA